MKIRRFFGLSDSLTAISMISVASVFITLGCESPLSRTEAENNIFRAFSHYDELELQDVPRRDVTLSAPPSALEDEFGDQRMAELEKMAGPSVDRGLPIQLGDDLLGTEVQVVRVGLQEAIASSIHNNLAVQTASMSPAIAEAGIVAAEARFDSVVVTNLGLNKTDQPAPRILVNGFPVNTGIRGSEDWRFRTGLQKILSTGGLLEIATEFNRTDNRSPGTNLFPDPAHSAIVELGFTQPLLRGFGSEVNLAEVRINQNTHRSQIETYRDSLLSVVNQTELAYWQLWQDRQAIRIGERLLERGIETRDKLVKRKNFDAKPSEISDAKSRVQTREVILRRARDAVLRSSDQLKQFMNAPGYPVGSEIMVVPTDEPIREPIVFNYRDAVLTALRNRPEIRQAILAIDDSSIRQMLADNLRLPRLDVEARVLWNGLDDEFDQAYGGLTDDDFVDYILNAVLEFPIGNRAAEANYRAARLQRMQAVVQYEEIVQGVLRQVKDVLRAVRLNYELLGPTRDARLAATENLRTITVQEEHQAALTPEFLNLKLQRQESLANAELDEVSTIATYQAALAQLYTTLGIALERNKIDFVVPEDLVIN